MLQILMNKVLEFFAELHLAQYYSICQRCPLTIIECSVIYGFYTGLDSGNETAQFIEMPHYPRLKYGWNLCLLRNNPYVKS